jgi:hypothetical protein
VVRTRPDGSPNLLDVNNCECCHRLNGLSAWEITEPGYRGVVVETFCGAQCVRERLRDLYPGGRATRLRDVPSGPRTAA